ncbi:MULTISPECIES: type II toxin-antitoxin system HicB family antitoxin [Chromobacterium]|uniref:Type II toxin-antitoxin system HicB family antitoxin n=2 Tax=Chromobacterium TaxID=535 RepID=A0ABV0FGU3_9NEIS
MRYPARFEPAPEGGFVVTFRDIPEAITQGDTFAEAEGMATDALLTAMDFYFEDRRAVPLPSSPEANEVQIDLPPSISAKVLLLNEMISQQVTNSELARRIGITKQEMNRITDLAHATKIDTIAKALHSLGRSLDISLV